jgi:cellulose synthase/poly-beta-1,6-N-acetylglucosamine synthase-like glycosyltransferase
MLPDDANDNGRLTTEPLAMLNNKAQVDEAFPLLSIIIPVRNDPERLERCLQSLLADDCPMGGVEIIVGDNGSEERSGRVAAAAHAQVVKLDGMNVASVRNGAAKPARGKFLAFIDADHTVERGWMRAALSAFDDPDVGAAGSLCLAPRSGTWVQHAYDRLRNRPEKTEEVEWLGSGNLVVRRDLFMRLEGFDTSLEACEDVDLCFRIRRAGFRILANPAMRNTHWGDPPTLSALFRAELWRGRNNLKVSLRKPISPHALASAAIPFVNLTAVLVAVCASILAPWLWKLWLILALVLFTGSLILRTSRMRKSWTWWISRSALENFAVAAVYEAARALAIMLRIKHGSRSR